MYAKCMHAKKSKMFATIIFFMEMNVEVSIFGFTLFQNLNTVISTR